jgi:glycosyltransferase involved in cell wall biosynthesis
MKICYISDLYPPFTAGGAETYLNRLVNEVQRKFDVTIITTMPNNSKIQKLSTYHNVKIIRLTTEPLYSLLDFTKKSSVSNSIWQICNLWNLKSFKTVSRILANEKPDIVHTHNFKGLSPSVFSAIDSGNYHHIHTVHDYNLLNAHSNLWRNKAIIRDYNPIDTLYLKYMKLISKKTHVVIFPSTFAMQYHKDKGFFTNNITKVIHNGISIGKVSLAQKKFNGKIRLLYVGNLTYYKGVQVLLTAFKQCKNSNIALDVVGVGEESTRLKSLANADSRITFHGRASHELLEELYIKANFLVFPSLWYEVLPVVIQESLSYGTPVIASSIGGSLDLVINGYNGYLFEPGDVSALIKIFTQLANDTDILKQLSTNSLAFVRKFDMEKHVQSIIELYEDTISGNLK